MKKKALIMAFLFGSAFSVCAQLVLSTGSQLVVNNGSVVVVNSVTAAGGTILNNGDVSVLGDVTNNGGILMDAASSGTLTFEGSSAQEITGTESSTFYGDINIDNAGGIALTNTATGADQTIAGTLNFINGTLTLNDFHLTIGSTDPTGASASNYVVTNGTGTLKRVVGASDVVFPVGNSAYNPLILNNTGTSDTYGVKVLDSKPGNFSGTSHIVNRAWVVSETTGGGSDLTVTAQWNAAEELTDFDRTASAIGHTTNNGTDVNWGNNGAAAGSNPYARSTSGITSAGTLMVGDSYYSGLVIDLQAFLAGSYNADSHNMDNDLNALLPLTDPYDGTTTVASIPSGAVDWVKIQLRDAGDRTSVLYSFARFIDQDGQIINQDGSDCKMTGVASGSYYIAILHRNHFGVVSNSTVNLADTPTLTFKGAQATAWQDAGITTNPAMKEVETGVFALWDGDANGDGEIKYNGSSNDKNEVLGVVGLSTPNNIVSSYSNADLNMDGEVKYNGSSNDKNQILSVVGLSTPNAIKSAHIPNL